MLTLREDVFAPIWVAPTLKIPWEDAIVVLAAGVVVNV
jgi:hypothetical protein